MKDIILVCEDLFGLEIYSIICESNIWYEKRGMDKPYNICGYISDSIDPFNHLSNDLKRLGSLENWKVIGDERYVLGIKNPKGKKEVVTRLKKMGCQFETVRAPWSLAPIISMGEGSILSSYTIKAGMVIGDFVTVIGAMLSSKKIGDYSTILRFSNITGNVGSGSYIGNHVYTHLKKQIGDSAWVEDGSIVVNNVKSGNIVSGVPARRKNY